MMVTAVIAGVLDLTDSMIAMYSLLSGVVYARIVVLVSKNIYICTYMYMKGLYVVNHFDELHTCFLTVCRYCFPRNLVSFRRAQSRLPATILHTVHSRADSTVKKYLRAYM